jgi:hypothetical protein
VIVDDGEVSVKDKASVEILGLGELEVELLLPHSELVLGLLGREIDGADHSRGNNHVKKGLLVHNFIGTNKYKFLQ